MPAGTIVLVGGINDPRVVTSGWRTGFRWAGLPHRLVDFRWQQGLWAMACFADLWRTAHHRRKAAELADLLRAARSDGPVHVVAHSAGTAITAYALERFAGPDGITSAAFVGSGLSPGYDLTRAVLRCDSGLLAVSSPLDWLTLGIGTTVLGTVDRRHRPAAGMVGFRRPSDPAAAARFTEVRWSPRFVRQGWLGGHVSERSPWFARDTLAAWVRQAEASAGGGRV